MSHSDESLERVPASYDPELSRLANSLAGLEPRHRPFDRDALMFRAGQASVPRTGWTWPLAVSLSSVLVAVCGVVAAFRAAPGPASPLVVMPAPGPGDVSVPTQPVQPPPTLDPDTLSAPYPPAKAPRVSRPAQIQEQLLRWGLDGLPAAPPAPARPRPESIEMLLRSF